MNKYETGNSALKSWVSFLTVLFLGIGSFSVFLCAMDVRRGTAGLSAAEAEQTQKLREDLAEQSGRIERMAEALRPAQGPGLAADAKIWISDLGGIHPRTERRARIPGEKRDTSPARGKSARDTSSPAPDLQTLVGELDNFSAGVLKLARTPEDRQLTVSISAKSEFYAAQIASAASLKRTAPDVSPEGLGKRITDPRTVTELDAEKQEIEQIAAALPPAERGNLPKIVSALEIMADDALKTGLEDRRIAQIPPVRADTDPFSEAAGTLLRAASRLPDIGGRRRFGVFIATYLIPAQKTAGATPGWEPRPQKKPKLK